MAESENLDLSSTIKGMIVEQPVFGILCNGKDTVKNYIDCYCADLGLDPQKLKVSSFKLKDRQLEVSFSIAG